MTGPYMPIISSRNEPLMPGRIMAHTATMPAPAKTRTEGSAAGPARSPSPAKTAAATASAITGSVGRQVRTILTATTIDPATKPVNRPAISAGLVRS